MKDVHRWTATAKPTERGALPLPPSCWGRPGIEKNSPLAKKWYDSWSWGRCDNALLPRSSQRCARAKGGGVCAGVRRALLAVPGAARVVVGHTIQPRGISQACGGRLWRVDVAMSRACVGLRASVLEIGGGDENGEGGGGGAVRVLGDGGGGAALTDAGTARFVGKGGRSNMCKHLWRMVHLHEEGDG